MQMSELCRSSVRSFTLLALSEIRKHWAPVQVIPRVECLQGCLCGGGRQCAPRWALPDA